jgi:hypothetical protein
MLQMYPFMTSEANTTNGNNFLSNKGHMEVDLCKIKFKGFYK